MTKNHNTKQKKKRQAKDIIGQRFGRLIVVEELPRVFSPKGTSCRMFKCLCDCGKYHTARHTNLSSGGTKSCGCLHREIVIEMMTGPNLKTRKYKTEELIGVRFGKLVVLEEAAPNVNGRNIRRHLLCRCDCGETKSVRLESLIVGTSRSCGCLSMAALEQRTTHDLCKHKLYRVWIGLKSRCLNPDAHGYQDYGGRGISVCSGWKDDFKLFYDWAMANGYEHGLWIDRRDNERGYAPDNCRFVTPMVSCQNTRLLRPRNTTGYRGIYWVKRKERWASRVGYQNKSIYLGSYKTKEEAAHAYDAKVVELGSEHPLNFPAE